MKTVTCACGEVLVAPPGAPSMVCAACMRTHVLVRATSEPASEIGTAETMAAIKFDPKLVPPSQPIVDGPHAQAGPTNVTKPWGVQRAPAPTDVGSSDIQPVLPTPPPTRITGHPERAIQFEAQRAATATGERRRAPPRPRSSRSWPFVLGAGTAIGAVIVAIGVFAMREPAPVVEPQPTRDAARPEPARRPSLEFLLAAEHEAFKRADATALAQLLAPPAFAFGPNATDIARGPDVATLLARTLGAPPQEGYSIDPMFTHVGSADDVAWIVEDIVVTGLKRRSFMTSQVAARVNGMWSVASWHWAILLRDRDAIKLALGGTLPAPAAITANSGGELEAAVRRAFSSHANLRAALSEHANAINIGSAPDERIVGGARIRKWLDAIDPTLAVRGGVEVGMIGDRAGWAAANVDFTFVVAGKPVTETFRVLAALIRERDQWRIVMLQWSNGGPFP